MARILDVLVVGLGHAGCEAALAARRMGGDVGAITLRRDGIGVMSCNPAIGGTAKGHLVRELDALGGFMGRAADLTGTHFKTLNESKGAAVRATRVLCDRELYARAVRTEVEARGVEVTESEVVDLEHDGSRWRVVLADGNELEALCVVLTTGTFLQAVMHVGAEQREGGRVGERAARGLSAALRHLGVELGRFKTGTPARLRRSSIDFARCEPQPGDANPRPFSSRTRRNMLEGERFPGQPQVLCHITYTVPQTHEILRGNLERSPLFRGEIKGRGPRYCPSLEDKVVRFADRDRHQVFLEPEGPASDIVYPAGISTSMPSDVQELFLRTIPGLEQVEILRYGYAVEYDFAPPNQLSATLESRSRAGLFFAGQINGTSGYEEAAIQGLVAGANALLRARGEPGFVLGREEAHAGVLIDELTLHGVDEPFRMLTSRSEHRLSLRESNADLRLGERGRQLGLIDSEQWAAVEGRRARVAETLRALRAKNLDAQLRRPEVRLRDLPIDVPGDVIDEVEATVKYEGYVRQQERFVARRQARGLNVSLDGLVLNEVEGLSAEVREKLLRLRPPTLADAERIPGVTAAAIDLLLVAISRARRDC